MLYIVSSQSSGYVYPGTEIELRKMEHRLEQVGLDNASTNCKTMHYFFTQILASLNTAFDALNVV